MGYIYKFIFKNKRTDIIIATKSVRIKVSVLL